MRVSEARGGLGGSGCREVPGDSRRCGVSRSQASSLQSSRKAFAQFLFSFFWGGLFVWVFFWYVLPLLEEEEQYDNILIEEGKIISNRDG